MKPLSWLFSISIIVLISASLYHHGVNEFFYNENDISFVEEKEAKDFIEKDYDKYVQHFSIQDLRARKVKTITEYIEKSSEDIIPFTEEQKNIIISSVKYANQYLKQHPLIQFEYFRNTPWQFILTNGFYEQGLPHTRGAYIFLSKSFFSLSTEAQINTLIHEKIHLFQRFYKELVKKDLEKEDYKEYCLRKEYPGIRANPDVDEYIYYHPSKYLMVATYKSDYPENIQDILETSVHKEHPYEEFAYNVAKYSSSVFKK